MRQVSVIGVRGLYCGWVCRRSRMLFRDSWQVLSTADALGLERPGLAR
jgi:hypothetical protein